MPVQIDVKKMVECKAIMEQEKYYHELMKVIISNFHRLNQITVPFRKRIISLHYGKPPGLQQPFPWRCSQMHRE